MTGYRRLPATDPIEQKYREDWYASEGSEREAIGIQLSNYLWKRTLDVVEEDRKRHPKKKRNLPVPKDIVVGEGRAYP